MKHGTVSLLLLSACLATPSFSDTVIKVLHIQKLPQVRAMWQEAADQYQKTHPGVKIQFDYLENEAFKAKLPTLLQSKDRPSVFHTWGCVVITQQVTSAISKHITQPLQSNEF